MSEHFEGLPARYRAVFCLYFTTSFSPNEVTGFSTTLRDSIYCHTFEIMSKQVGSPLLRSSPCISLEMLV